MWGKRGSGANKNETAGDVASSRWGWEGEGRCHLTAAGWEGEGRCPLMAAAIKGEGGKQGCYSFT